MASTSFIFPLESILAAPSAQFLGSLLEGRIAEFTKNLGKIFTSLLLLIKLGIISCRSRLQNQLDVASDLRVRVNASSAVELSDRAEDFWN